MPKLINQDEIDAIIAKGGKVDTIATLFKGSLDVPELVVVLKNLASAQLQASQAQSKSIIAVIDRLIKTVSEKEHKGGGLDISGLVKAVEGLKTEVEHDHIPLVDYELDIVRDNQGRLASGTKFKAIPRGES